MVAAADGIFIESGKNVLVEGSTFGEILKKPMYDTC
jgi:hypothetical protein